MLDQDDKIRNYLNRKEKILNMMKGNKYQLEKSLMNLDDSKGVKRSTSPTFK